MISIHSIYLVNLKNEILIDMPINYVFSSMDRLRFPNVSNAGRFRRLWPFVSNSMEEFIATSWFKLAVFLF